MKNVSPDSNRNKLNLFKISEGDISQLERIVDLNYEIFRDMYSQAPYSLKQYKEKLKDRNATILIAKVDDEIIADSISFDRQEYWYIWMLGVKEEHRQQGIATNLLELNEKLARLKSYKSVRIKVYNVSKEMLRLLLARNYQVINIEYSKIDAKYNAIHLESNL